MVKIDLEIKNLTLHVIFDLLDIQKHIFRYFFVKNLWL